jgi:Domain of unknown function (DUF4402)
MQAAAWLSAQPVLTFQTNANFGKALEDSTPGTVVLSPLSSRTTTGGATLFNGTVADLSFTTSGINGNPFTIYDFPTTLTLTGPGSTITVTGWTTNLAGGFSGFFGVGSTTVNVGGTLNLPASPVAGIYSGTFTLRVRDDTTGLYSPAVQFSATVDVGNALASLKVSDLAFGKLAASSSGTCTVSPAGVRSVTGSVMVVGSTATAGALTITGTPSATYHVTLPGSITLTGPSAATLTVDTFTSASTPTLALNGSGNGSLTVGATVHISPGQTSGAYTGSFNVNVAYD